jgi:hypothetical protein
MRQKLEDEQVRLTAEIEELKTAAPPTEPEELDVKFKERVRGVVEVLTSDCALEAKIKATKSVIEKIVYDKPNKTLEVYYRGI